MHKERMTSFLLPVFSISLVEFDDEADIFHGEVINLWVTFKSYEPLSTIKR